MYLYAMLKNNKTIFIKKVDTDDISVFYEMGKYEVIKGDNCCYEKALIQGFFITKNKIK